MTQIAVSDELAQSISSAAENRGCTREELMQHLVSRLEDEDAFAGRMLTPDLQARMLRGAMEVRQGRFTTEEEVDRKFDDFFRSLETR